MSQHLTISPGEAADRLAIRELVEPTRIAPIVAMRKARCLSLRPDTHFVVYMNAKDPKPSQELNSTRGARSSVRGSEQVCRHDALLSARVRFSA